jgi:hypothetical protein
VDDLNSLRAAQDRLMIGLLARTVAELTTVVGQLNALVGMETGENTDRHIQMKEDLFDVVASATRVGDHFAPPAPPEQV